jgi:REP element-mobilizing transposase RayT
MALTAHYYTKFNNEEFYHIYNRSVDGKAMFKSDDNCRFFLNRYDYYLSCVLDTYAYCLLGNHFHLLVKIKDFEALAAFMELSGKTKTENEFDTHTIVSHQFQKFFQSYAMAFNKQHGRTGTLFQTPFKRALVDSDKYFTQLVYYIHANPQLHGLIDDFKEWKWSSYNGLTSNKLTKLKKQEVLDWFDNVKGYNEYHSSNQKVIYNEKYILEDEL